MRLPVSFAVVLLGATALGACSGGCSDGCGTRSAPARVDAGTGNAPRPIGLDRSKAKPIVLAEVIEKYGISPSGAGTPYDGELVRIEGTVSEITPDGAMIQAGLYAAACYPTPGAKLEVKKGDAVTLTGLFELGSGHVAARITICEVMARAAAEAGP